MGISITVRCPKCQHRQTQTPQGLYWCDRCRALFDDDPDEGGGDYSDHNPAARLEREERAQERRKVDLSKKKLRY